MRNRNTGILLIAVCILTLLPCSAMAAKKTEEKAKAPAVKPPTIEEYITRGAEFVQKKDYPSAVKEYQNALKLDVKNPKANLLLGLTYANMGDTENAIKYTLFSLTIEKSYSAYHNLGLMYANKGAYKQAIEYHQKALALSPDSFRGWYQLGLVQQVDHQYAEAIASYRKAIQLNPKATDPYIGLGGTYYWSGDIANARAQVKALNDIGAKAEAEQLETWIQNKEAKKTAAKQEKPAEVKPKEEKPKEEKPADKKKA